MKKQSVLYGSFLLMVSVVVSKAAGLILKIPLANLLGGTGMGYYSGSYAVFMPLYALCAASLPPAIAQMVSESGAHGRYDKIYLTRRVCLIFFSAVSLILTAIPLLFSDFIATRIIGNPEARLSVMFISPCIFLGTVTNVYRGYYEGLKDMAPTAVSQMADAIVKAAAGLGLAYVTSEYAHAMYSRGEPVFGKVCLNELQATNAALPYISAAAVSGTVLADLAGLLYLLARSRAKKCAEEIAVAECGADCRDKSQSAAVLRRLLLTIAPIAIASVVSSLINTIDLSTIILMIKLSLRKHPELYATKYASIISSGVKMSELPNFLYGSFTGLSMAVFALAPSICSVFGKSAFASVAENYAKSDRAAVSKEIRRAICSCTYVAIPAGIGLSLFSMPVLQLLFKTRYAEISVAWQPLAVLALSTAFLAVSSTAYAMLQAIGRMDLPVKITTAGAVIKLALNTVLIPTNQSGLVGAAISTDISYLVMCVWSVAVLYKLTHTKPQLMMSVAIPLFGGVVCGAGGIFVYIYLANRLSNVISLCISVLFAVIVYILIAVLLDITTKNKVSAQIFR